MRIESWKKLTSSGLLVVLASFGASRAVAASSREADDDPVPLRNWPVSEKYAPPDTDPDTALSGAAEFIALQPCRLGDTRTGAGFSGVWGPPAYVNGTQRVLPVPSSPQCSGIPSTAVAYSLTFTVLNTTGTGFLSAWNAGAAWPNVSALNFALGARAANSAIVPAGTSGSINVWTSGAGCDVVIDINGYFTPAAPAFTLPYVAALSLPTQLLDIANTGTGAAYWATTTSGNGFDGYSDTGNAVLGVSPSTGTGVSGYSSSGLGVRGESPGNFGVFGTSSTSTGVRGETASSSWGAVEGFSTGYNGMVAGATGAAGNGIYAYCTNGANCYGVWGGSGVGEAGHFSGNVVVTGTLSKGAGSFRIDHPLDPQNKFLYHSFVESPDMMNIYNGNVVLDERGEAWVDLPAWFEALNREFRYQLTAIGAPGPDLYVADEVSENRFRIAGGKAGMTVSWMVTGVRHDAFAESNRIPVEVDKAANERGKYLHPAAFGLSDQAGIEKPAPVLSPSPARPAPIRH